VEILERILYRLPPGVKVRREGFGLLFYSPKDGKLAFVNCGNLINPDCLSKDDGFRLSCRNAHDEDKVRLLLRELVRKGLLFEERINI